MTFAGGGVVSHLNQRVYACRRGAAWDQPRDEVAVSDAENGRFASSVRKLANSSRVYWQVDVSQPSAMSASVDGSLQHGKLLAQRRVFDRETGAREECRSDKHQECIH